MKYFCRMKRLMLYCIIVVSLFAGLTNFAFNQDLSVKAESTIANSKEHHAGSELHISSANPFVLLHGERTESFIQITSGVSRTVPLTYLFRINYSTQLLLQSFNSLREFYLENCALKKYTGYYIYYLRKLLI